MIEYEDDVDRKADDLEVSILFAAIGTNKDTFNYVIQFLTPEDVELAASMVLRSKDSTNTEEFNGWVAIKIVSLLEREKLRQNIQTIH